MLIYLWVVLFLIARYQEPPAGLEPAPNAYKANALPVVLWRHKLQSGIEPLLTPYERVVLPIELLEHFYIQFTPNILSISQGHMESNHEHLCQRQGFYQLDYIPIKYCRRDSNPQLSA